MGFMEDAKQTAEAVGEKISRSWDDATDRIEDKTDEMKADAEVKRAEAERDSVHRRNEIKEELRDD